MNHDLKNFELLDVHMESNDKKIENIESQFSDKCITEEKLQILRKCLYAFISENQIKDLLSKCDALKFPLLYFLITQKIPTNLERKLCQTESFTSKTHYNISELRNQFDILTKDVITSNKNKTTMESKDETDHDEQNSDKTFDCSDCSLNPTDDDSDLEPDIITCQFIKIRNRPEKWQKNNKTELTKISGKNYGVEELEGLISWL